MCLHVCAAGETFAVGECFFGLKYVVLLKQSYIYQDSIHHLKDGGFFIK